MAEHNWTFLLGTRQGAVIADVTPAILNAKLGYRLNRPARAELRFPSAHEAIATAHTDGYPLLEPLRTLFGYRDGTLRFGGYAWNVSDSADEAGAFTTIIAYDPLMRLMGRWLRSIASTTYRIAIAYTSANPSTILLDQLDKTNAIAPSGVRRGTATGTFATLSRAYEFKRVGDLLSDLQPYLDFEVAPTTPSGDEAIGILNVYAKRGTDRTASVRLAYGEEPFNVRSVERALDAGTLANVLRAYGGQGIRKASYGEDATALARWGHHEGGPEQYPDVTVQAHLDKIRDVTLTLRKNPREEIAAQPIAGGVDPWGELWLGDTFTSSAGGALRGGYEGVQRCYGIDLELGPEASAERLELVTSSIDTA